MLTPNSPDTNTDTTGGEQPPVPSFGGSIPNLASTDASGSLSISDETPAQQPRISLADSQTTRPGLTGQPADQRAAKADFGLGANSPGQDVIANAIKTGNEDRLRQLVADKEDLKNRQTQLKLIQEKAQAGAPVTPDDIDMMAGLSTYKSKTDPGTVLEKKYADSYANSLLNVRDGDNVVAQTFKENPDHVVHAADQAASMLTKQEIAKSALEDIEQVAKNQSWTGWGVDQAKGLVPGYSWYKTYNAVEGAPTDGILKGNNIADQVSYLYSLPASEMNQRLRDTLQKLSGDNPGQAAEFARAVVSYGASDQFLDSVGPLADIATVLPVGKGAQLTGKALGFGATGKVVINAYKDIVRANAHPTTDLGAIVTASGDLNKGAVVNATKRASEIFGTSDPLREGQSLMDQFRGRVSSLFNPEAVLTKDTAQLSATQSERLVSSLQANRDKIIDAVTNLTKVSRTPEEALQVAFKQAQDDIASRLTHVNNSVIDYGFTRPEESAANVGAVTAKIAKPTGELFGSPQEAYRWAVEDYKLNPGSFVVGQNGTGWSVNVTKHLDETTKEVRDALITTGNKTPRSVANQFLGWLRSSDDRVSEFQRGNRIATVHGASGLNDAMKDMVKDIGALPRKERMALSRVMEDNRSAIDPLTNLPGKFHETVSDLEQAYQRLHGRLPSEGETKAYFTMTQLNDAEWMMRNLAVFRDRARQGIEKFILKDSSVNDEGKSLYHQSKDFHGKFVDDIPWSNKEDAGIVIHTAGSEPQYLRKGQIVTPETRQQIRDLLDKGYRVIQTENPVLKPFGDRFPNETTNFIITKDFENQRLDWAQIPYRPGWHTEYPQQWFVKQPVIRKAGDEVNARHVYEGDKAVMGFNTRAEAEKYASRMEEARQLYSGEKQGSLKEFLEKNLPFNEREFGRLFESSFDQEGKEIPAALSKNEPFLHTYTGKTTTDEHADFLKGLYMGLEDNVRSSYNLFANVDKKFLGQRDNPLWTVSEKGSEINPLYKLDTAKVIDPMSSVSRAMANVTRNRYFSDYKIQAVESWVREFGHLLSGVDKDDLLNNPVWHLHNPHWRNDASVAQEVAAAKLSRSAMLELLGTKSDVAMNLTSVKNRLLDSVYNTAGQGASDFFSDHLLHSDMDPFRWMRHVAFNTQIGLFNPIHMFQNAMTMTNVLAVAGPQHGLPGMAAGQLMNYMRFGEQHLDRMAKIAAGMGYKEDWFKEAFQELKKTGLNVVDGEHAWKDDFGDPKFFQGKVGSFLDKSAILFKEGERMTRLASWATAFKEWRSANPTATLTNQIRNQILARSDLLSANMTRASTAAWQQGIFSVPTQFLGYMTRLSEQMLSKRLTMTEKARVMATNGMLYGVPVGVGGSLVGAVWNPHEDVSSYLLNHGYDMGSNTMTAFQHGLVGLMTKFVTGSDNNTSERIGPGGNNVFRDILMNDAPFWKIAFGASGSKVSGLLQSADPFLKWATNPFRSSDDQFPLTLNDFTSAARNVASVDHAVKLYYAIKAHEYVTKTGTVVDDKYSTPEALWEAFSGGTPSRIGNAFQMKQLDDNRQKAQRDASKRIEENYRLAIRAANENNEKLADQYMQQVRVYTKLGGFRPDELSKLFQQVYKAAGPMTQSIPYDFAYKKASPDVAHDRIQNFENNGYK